MKIRTTVQVLLDEEQIRINDFPGMREMFKKFSRDLEEHLVRHARAINRASAAAEEAVRRSVCGA